MICGFLLKMDYYFVVIDKLKKYSVQKKKREKEGRIGRERAEIYRYTLETLCMLTIDNAYLPIV